jgi:hypothetical protein
MRSFIHFPSARLTYGTSMCDQSVCEPKVTISNIFFKYGEQKTNTNGITLNHKTWVLIHSILEWRRALRRLPSRQWRTEGEVFTKLSQFLVPWKIHP